MVTSWQEGKNTLVVPDYVNDVNTIADLKGKAASSTAASSASRPVPAR